MGSKTGSLSGCTGLIVLCKVSQDSKAMLEEAKMLSFQRLSWRMRRKITAQIVVGASSPEE